MNSTIAPPTVLVTPGCPTGTEVRQLMRSLPQEGRVALYPRVSSDKQVRDGYGLSYQEDQMRGFAEAKGYAVAEVVAEPGVSRTEFNRPGLERLRELARTGKIDAVLAWKRDRYFGDPGLRAMFDYEMENYGVRLLAMDDSGGDRSEDRFSDGIKDLLAQLEVAKTRERTVSGSLQKVRQGQIIIGRTVNYGFKANSQRNQYKVDEPTAHHVRRIFHDIGENGRSLKSVKDALNEEGIPSPTGKKWRVTQIQRIIINDIYKPHSIGELRDLGVSESVLAGLDSENHYGVWFYNRRRIETWKDPLTFETRTKATERPRQEWVAVPVPDIGVPRKTVDAAQERIRNNVRPSRSLNRVWELDEGLMRCGQCGRTMIPRHTPDRGGGPRPYYICNSYSDRDTRCSAARHYAAEKLEAEVASKLDKWFGDPGKHTRYLMERLEAERRKLFSGDPETQARALSERVAKLDRMKANYRRQQAEDVIDMGELKAVLAVLDSQQQAAKTELDNLLNRATRIEDMQRETKTVLDYFAALSQMGLEHLTPELRKGVYRKLHIQVTVEPDGSITIAGEPDVNYFPEVGEVDQATIEAAKEEAEQLARIVERSGGVLQSESHELREEMSRGKRPAEDPASADRARTTQSAAAFLRTWHEAMGQWSSGNRDSLYNIRTR